MKVQINRDNGAHLELYNIKARKNARKRKELKQYLKFAFISLVSILIFIWLINSPVEAEETIEVEKTALEQLIEEAPEVKQYIEEEKSDYEKFMEEWERIHEEKRKQYKEVEEKAFETIAKFEWYNDKPYWDIKQWSCGYGMRCSKDTTWITKEKSKEFVIDRIRNIRERHALYKYEDNIEVALISFIYNIGHPPIWYKRYIENNYTNWLKNMMRKYSYAWGKYMRWLAIRREFEVWLF